MYHKAGIEQLSNTQISRLLNGHSVRVKPGNGHVVSLSHEQAKKHIKASSSGKGFNLTMDPYQMDGHRHMHGEGIMKTVKKAVNHAGHFVKAHKEHFRPLASALKEHGHNAIADASMYALEQGVDPSLVSAYSNMGHEALLPTGGSLKSFVRSPGMKTVRRALKPLGRTLFNDSMALADQALASGTSQASQGMSSGMSSGMGFRSKVGMGHKGKRHGGALISAGYGY